MMKNLFIAIVARLLSKDLLSSSGPSLSRQIEMRQEPAILNMA
jgi:hypothetical protein